MLVVDGLEAIEIHKGDEHRMPCPLRQGEQSGEFEHQGAAVGKPGEGIGEGQAREFVVGLLQLPQQLLPLHLFGNQVREEGDELLRPATAGFCSVLAPHRVP